jgi:sporulation protein YlmC with PRC-barrel domain
MLRSLRDLFGYGVEARDGSIGKVRDALFDDERWAVRYLVVDTGRWLERHEVLISPLAVERAEWADWLIWLRLTRAQVQRSPEIDAHRPVSRQHELEVAGYYGWPNYWEGSALWGLAMTPSALMETAAAVHAGDPSPAMPEGDRHLQSARDVMGYRIAATDGEIGHVDDFVVDDESWAVRYMVVDTRNWLRGRKVLVATEWIREMRWEDASAVVDLSREAIEKSPDFDPAEPVNREAEVQLYDYYGRPHAWGEK